MTSAIRTVQGQRKDLPHQSDRQRVGHLLTLATHASEECRENGYTALFYIRYRRLERELVRAMQAVRAEGVAQGRGTS